MQVQLLGCLNCASKAGLASRIQYQTGIRIFRILGIHMSAGTELEINTIHAMRQVSLCVSMLPAQCGETSTHYVGIHNQFLTRCQRKKDDNIQLVNCNSTEPNMPLG